MDLDAWYDHARRDAAERGDRALVPLLDMLQRATRALRAADWAPGAHGDPGDGTSDDPEGRRAPDRRPPAAAPDRDPDRRR